MKLLLALFVLPTLFASREDAVFEEVILTAADGLEVTADLYLAHGERSTPFIVLCHQAGWSRGEYREIAPKLNELGFNCLAIDQRSGKAVNGVANETARRSAAQDKGTDFPDAVPDMVAAVEHARREWADGKVVLWGSSYSAALAFVVAAELGPKLDAVLAFSPGEYFARFGKPGDWIGTAAKRVNVPTFITSAKGEHDAWRAIHAALSGKGKESFLPTKAGHHGSRALWERNDGYEAYWKAVEAFLTESVLPDPGK